MFNILLAYLSDMVAFGSVDLVGTFAKYLDTLSSFTQPV
ncbi:UNVERIFIED_ORG: hypothetical protein FNL38_101272 [Nocardia globerula]|uniref:Uncharacterized protein n=1 Tax=Nocardia globerula TaxID=1818 RepID=A0A652YW28_NOCGL|nr:hypothetical protein SZ00_00168 [Rhodococcus sp. AD45]PVX64211.1 hypothetical protein C8E04_1484 [Rhodococcus globerulus]